jgi:hypothetical protein
MLFLSLFTSLAFALISDFSGRDFWIFFAAMMSGVTASVVLGATIGILTKNQQAAAGLAMPAAVIFGFGPVIAQFNDGVARVFHITYTQQLNIISAAQSTTPLAHSFAIMWANVAVLGVLFVVVFKLKGLKD